MVDRMDLKQLAGSALLAFVATLTVGVASPVAATEPPALPTRQECSYSLHILYRGVSPLDGNARWTALERTLTLIKEKATGSDALPIWGAFLGEAPAHPQDADYRHGIELIFHSDCARRTELGHAVAEHIRHYLGIPVEIEEVAGELPAKTWQSETCDTQYWSCR